MSPIKPTIAALVLIFLFAFFLWDVDRSETRILAGLQDERVLFFNPDNVTELRFWTAECEFVLEREGGVGGDWFIRSPRELRADQSVINSYLENLRGARRHTIFGTDDPSTYGFDNPTLKVSVTFQQERGAGMTSRTIVFGERSRETGRSYVKYEGASEIFTVSEWLERRSQHDLASLRDKRIMATNLREAENISVKTPRDSFQMQRHEGKWHVLQGTVNLPADAQLMERLFSTLDGARFLSIEDSPTSTTTELGLENPLVRVEADGEPALTVGIKVPGREQYVVDAGEGSVGVIRASVMVDLFRPFSEFGTKNFFWGDRNEIAQIESSSGNSFLFLMKEPDGSWIFPNSPLVPIRQDRIDSFINAIHRISATQFITGEPSPGELERYGFTRPSMELNVTLADGQNQGILIGTLDTQEGLLYVLRQQDRSVWAMDFRRKADIFRFRDFFEERRIFPGITEETDTIEITMGDTKVLFQRQRSVWMGSINQMAPVPIPPEEVRMLLAAVEDLNWQNEIDTRTHEPPQFTMSFYREGANQPMASMELIDINQTTEMLKLGAGGVIYEIPYQQYKPVDDLMVSLFLKLEARRQAASN